MLVLNEEGGETGVVTTPLRFPCSLHKCCQLHHDGPFFAISVGKGWVNFCAQKGSHSAAQREAQ